MGHFIDLRDVFNQQIILDRLRTPTRNILTHFKENDIFHMLYKHVKIIQCGLVRVTPLTARLPGWLFSYNSVLKCFIPHTRHISD